MNNSGEMCKQVIFIVKTGKIGLFEKKISFFDKIFGKLKEYLYI
jgi:hypothetical protein